MLGKTPRSIDLRIERLPKSGAGKVLKNQLRGSYWEGRPARELRSRTAHGVQSGEQIERNRAQLTTTRTALDS